LLAHGGSDADREHVALGGVGGRHGVGSCPRTRPTGGPS
jgi:hypothetical protein